MNIKTKQHTATNALADNPENKSTATSAFNEKKSYTKPVLTKFGKVSNLTKGGGSHNSDEGGIEPLF